MHRCPFCVKSCLAFTFLLVVFLGDPVHALSNEPDLVWPGYGNQSLARLTDSPLVFSLQSTSTIGPNELTPLWLHSNRWGLLDSVANQVQVTAGTAGVWQPFLQGTGTQFILDYQVIAAYPDPRNKDAAQLNTAFLRARYGPAELSFGLLPMEKGEISSSLSSGGALISRNARPIPRVHVGLYDYVSLPLTDGVVQVRGSIAHGWLEEDRYVESPWLHEKEAYVRLNDPFEWGLSIYRGLVHAVIWSGYAQDGSRRPSTWSDYWGVFRSAATGSESIRDVDPDSPSRDLSDTLGIWDIGVQLARPTFDLHAYHQHFFETGSGYSTMVLGNKWFRPQRIADGLWGVAFAPKFSRLLDSVVYELLYTKYQGGRGHPFGQFMYYDHHIYRTGWTHYGRSIGPALVVLDDETQINPFEHTRLHVHHLGVKLALSDTVYLRTLGTYSRNYGTYRRNATWAGHDNPEGVGVEVDELFLNGLVQWSFLAEVSTVQGLFGIDSLFGSLGIGVDVGEVRSDSIGFLLTIGMRDVVRNFSQ